MPQMTLSRNALMTTKTGHMITFTKNQPTFVPPPCVRDAIALGAEHSDGKEHDDFPAPVRTQIPANPTDLLAAIQTAIRVLVERNGREDFTAAGAPSSYAMRDVLGYKVAAQEIASEWQKYKEGLVDLNAGAE